MVLKGSISGFLQASPGKKKLDIERREGQGGVQPTLTAEHRSTRQIAAHFGIFYNGVESLEKMPMSLAQQSVVFRCFGGALDSGRLRK